MSSLPEPPLWHVRDRTLRPGRPPLVMGIVNVTPDSFSDGGHFSDAAAAVAHGLELARQGSDILDIGGESTRPGSLPVPLDEELARVLPVVRGLAGRSPALVSVDTSKAEVARRCLEAGADIVNDVTALSGDADMAAAVRDHAAGVILMHMRGTPATMQHAPSYDDVTAEVAAYLEARLQAAADLGIAEGRVALDPGLGFGKTPNHNLELLARLEEIARLGRPVCLGASRKGFLGVVTGRPLGERLAASLAAACFALARGSAHVLRVHDAAATRDAVLLTEALRERMKDEG